MEQATAELTEALRRCAEIIAGGERIPWGRQTALMTSAADEIEQLRRKNEHLLSCINGISRQCSEMVKANQ